MTILAMVDVGVMDFDVTDSDVIDSDVIDSGVVVSTDCEGSFTTPNCLNLTGVVRNLESAWTPLSATAIQWGERQVLEISAAFNRSGENTPPISTEIIESYIPQVSPSGTSEVTVTPLFITAPLQTSSVEINVSGLKADRIFQTGYQSWSFSGAIELPSELSLDEGGHLFVREALTGDPFHGAQAVSFGLIGGQVGDQAESGVWLIGHLDPTYTITAFTAASEEDTQIDFLARIGFENLPLIDQSTELEVINNQAQNSITQELSLITAPTMWLALRAYHELLRHRLELLKERDVRSAQSSLDAKRPPRGWYSWNERFEEIDSAYIMEHLNLVSERLTPSGFDLVEIDDGWQIGWGDWRANEHFPDDFEPIVDSAAQLELTLGIWFAPFLVDIEVATRLDYPNEWFVYPLDGGEEPLEHMIAGNPRTYYVLDTTHPEAMTHVLTELAARAAQGFTFFKLDFLYAAAIPGRRAEAVSGTESLRRGLAAIRQAIGQESFINACGAPAHAILGYADSLRIGADTTFGELYPSFIASAARSTAARAYLYPSIWPDGDQVQLRSPYSLEEATVGAYVAALSSAAYSIGDDLTRLPDERLDLFLDSARLWWADLPTPSLPLDLMSSPSPEWFVNPLPDHLRSPGGTVAPPPQRYLGVTQDGEARLLIFDWDTPFSAQVEVIESPSNQVEDQE